MKIKIRRLWAATLAALIVLSLCGCTFSFGKPEETEEEEVPAGLGKIGYATDGVTVVDNSESLSDEVRRLNEAAREDGIRIEYKHQAFSVDGQNFDCYIANPTDSGYDMFLDIYTSDFTEELFLSQLLRPGTAFENITLNRALTDPVTTVNVVYTQVYTDDAGELQIRGQTVVTLEMVVISPDNVETYVDLES